MPGKQMSLTPHSGEAPKDRVPNPMGRTGLWSQQVEEARVQLSGAGSPVRRGVMGNTRSAHSHVEQGSLAIEL